MANNIPTPPALMGTESQQIGQIRSYLFRISEMLNAAMTEQNVVLEATTRKYNESVSEATLSAELDTQYNNVKSLIIKTADIVEKAANEYALSLGSSYIAKSEWGSYEETIRSEITAGAESVVQSYDYQSQLNAKVGIADFESYKLATSGYIQSGIIGYGDDNIPIIGIAIGQDLKSKEVTIDGTTYSEIDMTSNLATYTSDRITFWQNGNEVAYISNSKMGITSVHVNSKITMGDNDEAPEWDISRTNGFTIKWVGGE